MKITGVRTVVKYEFTHHLDLLIHCSSVTPSENKTVTVISIKYNFVIKTTPIGMESIYIYIYPIFLWK